MATPSSCSCSVGNYSAHSNPNVAGDLQNSQNALLIRSNSQPPELFNWKGPWSSQTLTCTETATQTDQLEIMHNYILENQRHVLEILGLDPDKILNGIDVKKSQSIPDYFKQCKDYSSDFSNNKLEMCTVDVCGEEDKEEHCPLLSQEFDKGVPFFKSLNSNKTNNPLLKF